MRILFSDQELAGFTANPAQDVRVNGQIVYASTEVCRAAAKSHTAYGNLVTAISFSALRTFATIKEAEVFLLTHYGGLTKEGTAEIQCGTDGGDCTPVYFPGAVLTAMPRGSYDGLSVSVDYAIVAGLPSLEAP